MGSSADIERDETAIRAWYDGLLKATTEGDKSLAESLIADDAVFIMPGGIEMDKAMFATGMTASDGTEESKEYDLDAQIKDMRVFGNHAWVWSTYSLTITDKASGDSARTVGHAMSALERAGDGWVTVREVHASGPKPVE